MRALTWHGKHDVRVDTVPDPEIVNPRDAIIKVTSTAICGSDLHLYDGVIPGMLAGDILANAERGLGGAFLTQDWDEIEAVIHLNVTGTTLLLHRMARQMRATNSGRILIVGSVAGLMSGSYQAVYNATKAYLDTLSWAIRNELGDTDVTVTCLMPGPTDTEFFARAHMQDTPVGKDEGKDDPAMVARQGYRAMLRGSSGVTTGFMNKVQRTLAGVIPDSVLAKMHRDMAEPEGDRHG